MDILNKENKKEGYFYLGFLYENGLGVQQDYKIALMYYKKANELGLVASKNKLGDFMFSGLGLEGQDI